MNLLWNLIEAIDHEHSALGGEVPPYLFDNPIEARSIILWFAASKADTAFCFQRMARRWWIHASKHPEDEWVKSVNKLYVDGLAEGLSKNDAELRAFFRRPGRFKPLLKLRANLLKIELSTEYPFEDDISLHNRIYRKLRKHGAQSPDNIRKIIKTKSKHIKILSV